MLVAHLARHSFRRRPTLTLRDRLSMLPRTGLPITAPVTIYWDDHQIPFIKAATDDDLAVALGLVHAHLRLGQLEMMRRLATGRGAEMAGTIGIEIDRLMRTPGLRRPGPGIMRGVPEETRRWLDRFVRGLNHYIANARTLPPEFHLFGLGRDPWTSLDVLTLGRLVSIDVNWLLWLRLLKFRDDPDWKSVWRRLVEHDLISPNATDPASGAALSELLGMVARTGSNSFAVSSAKSASGAPLLASDPHLSLFLPNPWLIVGMNSPSHHAVGLMIPGLPFVALGRN